MVVRCSSRVDNSPSRRLICWLSAERANAQIQRGAAHAAELDDPDEVAQLTQFHRVVLRLPPRACALHDCAMLASSHGD